MYQRLLRQPRPSRTVRVATLLAVLAATLVVSSANADASAPTHTRIVVSTYFTINGELATGLKVTKSVSGYCWLGSEGSQRSDAWRCGSGNYIYDPCFSGGPPSWVACPTGAHGIIRLNLTRPLRNGNPPLNTNRADPALVTLLHGVTCGFSGGATGTVAGLRLNYACSNGAWLIGSPNRASTLWTILELPSLHSTQAHAVAILVARY